MPFFLVPATKACTFDNPPTHQLQTRYGYTPTRAWLDHVRLADELQKISTPQHDYFDLGFYAATQSGEIKSPDLEINVLESMENVTSRAEGAVKPAMTDEQARPARQAEMALIEKESLAKTGLRSDVVTLYHGAEYWLYRYKKYTDVRLVFAPEQQAAFFGGNDDNFTYPRYDLDMALFRV